MKHLTLIALLCLLPLASFGLTNPGLERRIRIGDATAITLTAESLRIVVLPGASPTARFAADELRAFLEMALGKKITVANEAGAGCNIFVGFSEKARAQGLSPEKLSRDGYYIKSVGSDIYIAGRDDAKEDPGRTVRQGGYWSFEYERATLFGVYDFLERFAGCRFYFPGELGTVVPAKTSIAIPQIDIVEKPDNLRRWYLGWYDGEYFEGDAKARNEIKHPQKNLNMMRLRVGTTLMNCCHGIANGFDLLNRFGSSHPEYFQMKEDGARDVSPNKQHSGQLCWSSKVTEEIYTDLQAYFSGKPATERGITFYKKVCWPFVAFHKGYVDVMPQDSFTECHCPSCKAAKIAAEDYATELVWDRVIDWGERLKKEALPGILSMSAYYPYRGIPKRAVPDNIEVQVCTTGPWLVNPVMGKADNDIISRWAAKLDRKVHLWNYVNKHGPTNIPGVPAYTPRTVGAYYKTVAPYIYGAFMETECDKFIYFAMNYYVFCKVMWNDHTDVDALMDEYYQLMFGKAAPVMKSIMEDFEDTWVNRIVGRTVNTPLGPVPSVPGSNSLWNDIYSPAKLKSTAEAFDKASRLVEQNSIEARRIALFRHEFLDCLEKTAREYLVKTSVKQGVRFAYPRDKIHLVPFTGAKARPVKGEVVDTTVSAAIAGENLVVTFDCEEPRLALNSVKARPHDDGNMWRDSSVEVFLDPSGEGKTYFQWMVNARGDITDVKYTVYGKNSTADASWESGATAKASQTRRGYAVEIAIPLNALGNIAPKEGMIANFGRSRVLNWDGLYHDLYVWSPFVTSFHNIENFGRMQKDDNELVMEGNFDNLTKRDENHWGYYDKGVYYGWIGDRNLTGKTSCTLVNDVFFSAPASMRIVSDREAGLPIMQMFYHCKFKPNTTYRISCMFKMENVVATKANGGFGINLWDNANRWYPKANWLTGTSDWSYLSFTHKTNDTVDKSPRSYLKLWLRNATGTVWIDNVSVQELAQ